MTVLFAVGVVSAQVGAVAALLHIISLRARVTNLERRLFCTHRVSMLKRCHQCDRMPERV